MPEIIDCNRLGEIVANFSLQRDCDVIGQNTLRISTPFLYPDGSNIDLFLEQLVNVEKQDTPLYRGYVLSDLGETAAYLHALRVQLSTTKRRRQIVSDICEVLGVENERGQLQIKIIAEDVYSLPDAMSRLAQACIRVADLSFSQRFIIAGVFMDEVEETIDQTDLAYEVGPVLPGRHGKPVQVDFRVNGQRTSLIRAISPSNSDYAHVMFNEAFTRWYSLSGYRQSNQLLTVVEDKEWNYRDDDLARLEEVSDAVIRFPSQRQLLKRILVA